TTRQTPRSIHPPVTTTSFGWVTIAGILATARRRAEQEGADGGQDETAVADRHGGNGFGDRSRLRIR
ncbi:hypothetical protein, partial [Nocardia cyriacigeorgica]|uniref:hypothetical protein n=1 Tax=Nocardia cyriacigeorgica TaxID=135487 RepID=UPI002457DCCF